MENIDVIEVPCGEIIEDRGKITIEIPSVEKIHDLQAYGIDEYLLENEMLDSTRKEWRRLAYGWKTCNQCMKVDKDVRLRKFINGFEADYCDECAKELFESNQIEEDQL